VSKLSKKGKRPFMARKRIKAALPRRKLQLEALEPRLLLSADLGMPPELQQEAVLPDLPELQATNLTLPADSAFFNPLAVVDTALAASFEEVA